MASSLIGKTYVEATQLLEPAGWHSGERFDRSVFDWRENGQSNYEMSIFDKGVTAASVQSPSRVVEYVDTFTFDKDPRNGIQIATDANNIVIGVGEAYLDKGNWLSDLAGALLPAFAFSFAAPYLAGAISSALGTSASVSASLANIGLATATNGGDVEAAIKSALIGGVSGAAGSYAGAAADSALVAKLTSTVVGTAINGGDVGAALGMSLVTYGAGSAGAYLDSVIEPASLPFDPAYGAAMDDIFSSNEFAFNDPLREFSSLNLNLETFDVGAFGSPLDDLSLDPTNFADAMAMPAIDPSSGTVFQLDPDHQTAFIAAQDYADNDLPGYDVLPIAADDYADNDLPGYAGEPSAAPSPTAIPRANSPYTFAEGLRAATSLAMAAIQVSMAYQQAQRPAPVSAGARISTAGNTVTAQADGSVTVRSPAGQVTSQRPPTGVPYATADGGVVVNNGDGTYTLATSSGAVTTRPYVSKSAVASGGDTAKALIIGGAALTGLLLLSK